MQLYKNKTKGYDYVKNLEKCITTDFITRNCKECDSITKIEFASYIIMNVQPNFEPIKGFKKINIKEIPMKLIIKGHKPGHFVSHCLRKNKI